MSDFSDTIKGFYSDFILRDLLSFVTPGAIVVFSIIFFFVDSWPKRFHQLGIIPWPVWIPIFGLFYIIGITMQFIGEWIGVLKFPSTEYRSKYRDISMQIQPDDRNDTEPIEQKESQFIRQFGCDELFRKSKYYAEFRLPFIKKIRELEVERKIHESFIFLMQASGNSGVAFLIVTVFLIINFVRQPSLVLILMIAVVFIASIFLTCNFHIQRQRLLDWEFEVVKNQYR